MSSLLSKKFTRNTHFPWQTIGEETIIVDPSKKNSFELDKVGTFIWGQFDGVKSLSEILQLVNLDFEVSEIEAEKDLLSLTADLIENQLILEKRT